MMTCETILGQRDCPCVHETCTDGRVCDHLKRDTAGPDGDRRFTFAEFLSLIDKPLTPAELAAMHDRGDA